MSLADLRPRARALDFFRRATCAQRGGEGDGGSENAGQRGARGKKLLSRKEKKSNARGRGEKVYGARRETSGGRVCPSLFLSLSLSRSPSLLLSPPPSSSEMRACVRACVRSCVRAPACVRVRVRAHPKMESKAAGETLKGRSRKGSACRAAQHHKQKLHFWVFSTPVFRPGGEGGGAGGRAPRTSD